MRPGESVRLSLAIGLALVTCGCVPVDPIALPDRLVAGTDVPMAGHVPPQADLVCIHDPSPGLWNDGQGFAALGRSLRNSALARACPKFHGQGVRGRWVESYRTLVISLKDCQVVSIGEVTGWGGVDGAPSDFCTTPERLAVIDAPWNDRQKILIDTKKRPDALGTTPR